MTPSASVLESHVTIQFTGHVTVSRDAVRGFALELEKARPNQPSSEPLKAMLVEHGGLPHLCFNIAETAEILRISKESVYRLLERGLLRSSLALRRKLISRKEIERFLDETRGLSD